MRQYKKGAIIGWTYYTDLDCMSWQFRFKMFRD